MGKSNLSVTSEYDGLTEDVVTIDGPRVVVQRVANGWFVESDAGCEVQGVWVVATPKDFEALFTEEPWTGKKKLPLKIPTMTG